MAKRILNKNLRKALEFVGLEDIDLWKSSGYFFITSDAEPWKSRISKLYCNSILRYKFNETTVEGWVKEIVETLITSRHPYLEDWQEDLKKVQDVMEKYWD